MPWISRTIVQSPDYLLIAEGNVDRHVISIARAIMEDSKERPIHVEGLANGDWVVLDFSGYHCPSLPARPARKVFS